MTSERWHQIEKLFHSALELPSEARATFLSRECANDESLRDEVNSLLRAHERDGSFLDVPAYEVADSLLTEGLMGLSPGQQIGPYQIISLLVEGGMGELYLAHDNRLSRKIVLKLLPIDFARDRHRVRRFVQEARVASNLNHPNVCVIHEIGRTMEGRHFIAMEYIEGVTLRERISRQPFTLSETLHVAEQVCAALMAAHAAGVIHRDIKPENIMLRRDRLVKVLDFGLAKLIESESRIKNVNEAPTMAKLKTEEGTQMGTVRYMSPEQLREGAVDERTDVWSFGVVLHEMVTGFAPFEARVRNEIIAAILKREATPLSFDETTPEVFQRIVAKALSKERNDRYQTVGEMAGDLKVFRRQIQGDSTEEPLWPVDVPSASGSKKRIANGGSAGRRPRPQPRVGHGTASDTWSSALTYVSRTAEHFLSEIKGHPKATVFAGLAVAIALLWYIIPRPPKPFTAPENKTNSGQSVCAAISPDGKLFAHAEKNGGKQELVVTNIATSSGQVVVPAGEVVYRGVTFSRDSNYLYFTRSAAKSDSGSLYQVAFPGNVPRKLLDGVDTPVSFSPSGDRLAFVRVSKARHEYSLVIVGVDGTGERTIATRPDTNTITIGPAWSPDGKTIVCAGAWWDKNHRANLVEIDVDSGVDKPINTREWFSIYQVAWLDDKSGLVVCAKEEPLSPIQLWRVSYPSGEVSRITNDTSEYETVSIARDSSTILAVQRTTLGKVWVAPNGNAEAARSVASTVGRLYGHALVWTSNGKIILSSLAGKNLTLWLVDPQGSSPQTQLTPNQGDNYTPATSPDGRIVVFASNRNGSGLNIWRMNAEDGSDLQQLTFTTGNSYPSVSADGKWVLYDNQSKDTTVWKVPINSGEPVRLTSEYSRMPVESPDGQFFASRYLSESGSREMAVFRNEGGAPIERLPISAGDWQQVEWMPNGRALIYIDTIEGVSNLWTYDLASRTTKQLTYFKSDQIFSYAWSNDRTLACLRGTESRDVTIIKQ